LHRRWQIPVRITLGHPQAFTFLQQRFQSAITVTPTLPACLDRRSLPICPTSGFRNAFLSCLGSLRVPKAGPRAGRSRVTRSRHKRPPPPNIYSVRRSRALDRTAWFAVVNDTIALSSSPTHRLADLGADALTEIDALSLLLDASDSTLPGDSSPNTARSPAWPARASLTSAAYFRKPKPPDWLPRLGTLACKDPLTQEGSVHETESTLRCGNVAGARAAIRAARLEPWQCPSANELARKIAYRKESTNLALLGFFRRRRTQKFGIRAGLNGSTELGDFFSVCPR
jgi:hypothetical protein